MTSRDTQHLVLSFRSFRLACGGLLFAVVCSCSSPPPVRQENVAYEEEHDSLPEMMISDEEFTKTDGFLILEPADVVISEPVVILNTDGTPYFTIDHQGNQYQDSSGSFPLFFDKTVNKAIYTQLNIWEIAPEYGLYHFTCTRQSEHFFEVCVDECYQVYRYISKKNTAARLYPTEEYVKAGFIRPKNRRIHTDPGKSKGTYNTGENFYKAIEIRDDWAYVDCLATGCDCQYDQHNQKGWVRWRQGGKLLVEFAWICEPAREE